MQTQNIVNVPAGTITNLQTTGGNAPYQYRVLNNPNGFVVSQDGTVAVPSCLTSGAYPLTIEVVDHSNPPVVEQHYIHLLVVAGATTHNNTGAHTMTTPTHPMIVQPYTPPASPATPPFVLPTATPHPLPTELDGIATFIDKVSDGHAKVLRAGRGLTPVAEANGGVHSHSTTNWPAIIAFTLLGLIGAIAVVFALMNSSKANTAVAGLTPVVERTVIDVAGIVPTVGQHTTDLAVQGNTLNRTVIDVAGIVPTVGQHTTDLAVHGTRLGAVETSLATTTATANQALTEAQRPRYIRTAAPATAPTSAPQPTNGALTPEQYQAWLAANPPSAQPVQIEVVPPAPTGR